MSYDSPADDETWETHVPPQRRPADPYAAHSFVRRTFNSADRDQIADWVNRARGVPRTFTTGATTSDDSSPPAARR